MREFRIPPGLDASANAAFNQAREIFRELVFISEPRRNFIVEDTDSLPDPAQWEGADVYIRDIGSSTPMRAYSDGANWRRFDTNATL